MNRCIGGTYHLQLQGRKSAEHETSLLSGGSRIIIIIIIIIIIDRLCGSMVRVPDYRSRGPGSIPGSTRFSEKQWFWNGVHSAPWVQLRSYLEEKVAAPV
jgi:hypothetical protein